MAKKTSPLQPTTENADLKSAPFFELGITGVTRYGALSRVYEEFLKELQGPAGMKLYREQKDNCPITGAFLFAAQHLCRKVIFRIDPKDSSPEASQVAARIRGALFDDMLTTWPDTLSEILTMLPFGWSALEMVFKRCLGECPPSSYDPATGLPKILQANSLLPEPLTTGPRGQGPAVEDEHWSPSRYNDGFIGLKKISLRAQETLFAWEWDDESNARVLQQMAPPDYRVRRVPLAKCLHFRTETSKNNPEGRSVLRNSVLSYIYRKNIQNIEAVGVERDLAGYPVLQMVDPSKAAGQIITDPWNTQDPKAVTLLSNLKSLVREIKRDEQEGLVLPWWVDFKLMSAGGARRQFDTNQIIDRYDQRIAMSVLADFIIIGHQSQGASRGLASTKSAMFTTALSGMLSTITSVFNRFAIPLLCRLNGIDSSLVPEMVHGDVENIDLADLGVFISNLSRSGMPLFPDPDLETALLEAAKLPTGGIIDPTTEQYGTDSGGLDKRLQKFSPAARAFAKRIAGGLRRQRRHA